MLRFTFATALAAALCTLSGCATVVEGHERALFWSAGHGMTREPLPSGWYWHAPWNSVIKYDMRWTSHKEEIHLHSKDGLHLNVDVVVVVRPDPTALYELDTQVGPAFYDQIVRPALFGAARDASGQFNHVDIAVQTHKVEEAIRAALVEHLKGQPIELAEVAIQHFDLPPEVEVAANKKAAAGQLLAAKEVELGLAQRDAEIEQARRRGVIEAQGLERKLAAEQELLHAQLQASIEEAKRKTERTRAEGEAESALLRAEGEAKATKVRADAERTRIAAASQNLTPNYIRLQAIEALAKTMSGENTRMLVMPVGKDGLPAFFGPFLNPYGASGSMFGALDPGAKAEKKAN
jgi:regulator of protease activity HflC (stomatin/prohibitin superfamily)